jgi:hypothetical protein
MTTYSITSSSVHSIRSGDPDFVIRDDLIITNRASFEIAKDCPQQYGNVIRECIAQGWLKPVAHITQGEKMFACLTK